MDAESGIREAPIDMAGRDNATLHMSPYFNRRPVVSVMIRLLVPVLFILSVCTAPGRAFEVDGLRSGMSVEEALKIAGDEKANVKTFSPLTFVRTRFGRKGKNPGKSFYLLHFCNGGLQEVMKFHQSFRWAHAAAIVSRLNERYGRGSVEPSLSFDLAPSSGASDSAASTGLTISWGNEEEWVTVTMELVSSGESKPGTTQETEEVLREYYSLRNSPCDGDLP